MHAQNGYLWTCSKISDVVIRFPVPISLQSAKFWRFGDVFRWFFCILYAECLPYFNFRFDWHTDLERIPHALTSKMIIPTKFEVDMTIHCRVIAFLSADTSRDLSTLNSCCTRVAWPTFPPSLKTLRLSLLELSYNVSRWLPLTRCSAIAEGPRDASCQLKSCQLPRNSAQTTCTASPEQIEVTKLECYSGLHPLRSSVTSVLSHFGPRTEVHIHFGL